MSETTDRPPAHPARAALAAVDDALAQLASANLWSMSESDLLDLRIDLEASRARLESVTLSVTREVDGRGAATATGAPSTAAWLRAGSGCTRVPPRPRSSWPGTWTPS
jgi:hypothetical protein